MQQSSAPAVSVVISTFRRPHFLNQALDSVYAQTFTDFEVIVADDGSGEDYTSQYNLRPDTILVCNPRPGCGSAITRNLGTRVARGQYIAYLDDDDIWLPEKLERQIAILESNPDYGLTYCHYVLVDSELRHLDSQPEQKSVPAYCVCWMLRGNLIKSPSCVLIRREVLDECGLFDERLLVSEDWEFFARISYRHQFYADPRPMVLYRTHGAQKTAKSVTRRRLGQVRVVEAMQEWVESDIPKVLPLLRRSLAFRLQRVARWQARDGDYRGALTTIRRSLSLYPWDYRSYGRLFQILAYALTRCGKAEPAEVAQPGGS